MPNRGAPSVEALQQYFDEHAIQANLNTWLNELVQHKPAAPYAWLASRIRARKPKQPAPSTPVLSREVAAAEIVAPLAKRWMYCDAFRGPAAPAANGGSASADDSLKVSIEAVGSRLVVKVQAVA